jgi:NitT/TauT family transport system substrate-binding protein
MRLNRRDAALAMGAAVTAPFFPRLARAADLPTVKVGMLPIEPSCQPYYADQNGYLQKAGIALDISVIPTSPVIMQALLSGTYDIGYSTITTLIVAHTKGIPIVIIAPSGIIANGVFQGGIVVPANSTIKNARDFNGKTFAVSGLGTQAEFLPRAWIDKNGGDSTTVKFVEVPFPVVGDALAAGRADASYLVEPFFTIATKKGQVKLLTTGDDAIAPAYLASAWYATSSWANGHPDLVARFARAMDQAAVWANANPDKVVPIVASKLQVDPQLITQVHRATFTDKIVDAQIQPWINVLAKYQGFQPFTASDLVFRPR